MKIGKIRKTPLLLRKSAFKEVSLGFSEKEAETEAKRCLQCKNPACIEGCPIKIDIKEFIKRIIQKDYKEALNKIREKNTFPAVCGRVCPQEDLCQYACVLNKTKQPIKIGYLERFAADYGLSEDRCQMSEDTRLLGGQEEQKIAVIGSGPAGLTCAGYLAKRGFSVTVFEALHKAGGVLGYGIPEFRLPREIIDKEINYIKSLGVKIHNNFIVGKTKTIDELKKDGFYAFFVGVGAGAPVFLNIPGEHLSGVYSANEFLTRINLMKGYLFPHYHTPVYVGKKVGVIGAGNVAIDCARSALRLGAKEVFVIYRRTSEESPARAEEIENAKEEGIKFKFLTSPKEILSDREGKIARLVCIKNKLGEKDSSGRRTPIPMEDSEFKMKLNTIIIAIGIEANPLFIKTVEGLKLNKRGYIDVDGYFRTSLSDIFAGGDIVSGSATVISAISHGLLAAISIEKFIKHKIYE